MVNFQVFRISNLKDPMGTNTESVFKILSNILLIGTHWIATIVEKSELEQGIVYIIIISYKFQN